MCEIDHLGADSSCRPPVHSVGIVEKILSLSHGLGENCMQLGDNIVVKIFKIAGSKPPPFFDTRLKKL